MAENTTLNPMLQSMAALRNTQGTPSTQAQLVTDSAAETPASFSQALKSANEAVTKQTVAAPAPKPDKAVAKDEESTDASVQQAEAAPDAASQATAALLALQSALVIPAKPSATASVATEASTVTSAIATASNQTLGIAQTTKQAVEIAPQSDASAALTASLAALSSTAKTNTTTLTAGSTSNSVVDDGIAGTKTTIGLLERASFPPQAQTPSDASTTNQDSGKNLMSDPRALIAEELLHSKDTRRETESAASANAFNAELSNAQAAYGTKTEVKLENQATNQAVNQYTVNTPVNAHNWADEIGGRLSWVASKDNGRADLVLNPPQMGKIEVSINLNGDQASASFTAANQATRDALQDALPRLREILADAGIQLGQANVSAGNSDQAQAEQNARNSAQSRSWQSLGAPISSTEILSTSQGKSISRGNGLVDLFA